MPIYEENSLVYRARKLRLNMTPQENHLWYDFLRPYPLKIRRQAPIGCYIADFYCAAARLVIEVDGSQHYEHHGPEYDMLRTQYLHSLGISVLRYSNRDINLQFQAVCEDIHTNIQKRLET